VLTLVSNKTRWATNRQDVRHWPFVLMLAALVLLCGCAGVGGHSSPQTSVPSQSFSISGAISPAAGGSGATVTLSGASSATTTANASGSYTFSGLPNGNYVVTPSRTGYTFSPTSQTATVNGQNVTGVNFTDSGQTGQTFSISGTISPTAGGSGATLTLSGAISATTTANSSGSYTFGGLPDGSYSVTPSHAGYTFSPANQSVTINAANVTGINFNAQLPLVAILSWTASTPGSVSGYNVYRSTVSGTSYSKINSSLVTGLTYTDSTVQSGQTYYFVTTAVGPDGNESLDSNEAKAVVP
jgi:hypothetical protein